MLNDTANEHVYTVDKRVSIREETGVNSKELRSEDNEPYATTPPT